MTDRSIFGGAVNYFASLCPGWEFLSFRPKEPRDKNITNCHVCIWSLTSMSLFQVNPFKDRICKVFSSSKDGELTFEDFLDMMSVFSENVSCLYKLVKVLMLHCSLYLQKPAVLCQVCCLSHFWLKTQLTCKQSVFSINI